MLFKSATAFLFVCVGLLIVPVAWNQWSEIFTAPNRITTQSTGPTITDLQSQGDLVTLKVSIGDVLEAENGSYKGAWLVKGDALVAVDLRQAKLKLMNKEKRLLVIQIPNPTVISPRLDHEKTKTYSFRSSTYMASWGWGDPGPIRDEAMKQAQRLVQHACSHPEIIDQARTNAVQMIRGMFRFADYEVDIEWNETEQKAANEN